MHVPRSMFFAAVLFSAVACMPADGAKSASDLTDAGVTGDTPVRIEITPGATSITVGDTVRLATTFTDSTGTPVTGVTSNLMQWSSSDPSIATVLNGIVMGLKGGMAKIFVHTSKGSDSSTVTVVADTTKKTTTTTTTTKTDTTTKTTTTSTTKTTPTTPTGSWSKPGLSGDAFVYDDYTKYSNTQALLANVSQLAGGTGGQTTSLYNDGANATLAAIDPSVPYNGHPSVKYNQPGGSASSPELWAPFPGGKLLTKMWIRFKVRYSPGFTTYGITPNCANAYKLLGWGWHNANGRGAIGYTNTDESNLFFSVTSDSLQGGNGDDALGPRAGAQWTDGNWYDYIIYYEQTSATTIRQRWWLAIDGQQPVLQLTQVESMTKGNAPPVDRIMIGINFNSQRPTTETQALWFGQWEVIDGSQYTDPFGLISGS